MDDREVIKASDGGVENEIGVSGLKRTSHGVVQEEFIKELVGAKARRAYARMEADPIVGAVLFAIEMLLRQVPWRVERVSDAPADVEAADFLESCMNDMSHTWASFIVEVLSMLPYGWALHEIVYKRRLGDDADSTKRSKYNDGRIGWRKLPLRGQETITSWLFDDNGGITGARQRNPMNGAQVTLPIEKLLLFRTTERKNNPEGRSILRTAYWPWYRRTHAENIEAIGVERDLAGLPVAEIPASYLAKNASAEQKSMVTYMKGLITAIRRDEQEGVVWPLEYDDKGNKRFTLSLLTAGGKRQFDTDAIILRYARWIAMTVLADFIMLGHEKVGSFALSNDKTDLFGVALGAWLDSIQSVINRFAVPRLFSLNAFAIEDTPMAMHGDVETPDLKALGDYITAISGAGAPLFPNAELEAFLLDAAGLPSEQLSSV